MPKSVHTPIGEDGSGLNEVHAKLATEAAGLGLGEWVVGSDEVTVNATLATMLGLPRLADGVFASSRLVEITHPDDRGELAKALYACFNNGDGVFFFEPRICLADSSTRYLWIKASVVEWRADGKVHKIVGVVQDRTDAKLGEIALEREKRRNDLALSGSLIAVWDWDITTNQVSWSPRLSTMLGLPIDQLSGSRDILTDRVHPEDRLIARSATNDHLERGAPYDATFRLVHSDGQSVTVRSRGTAEFDSNGSPVRMAGSLIDITKERDAEAAARRLGLRSQLAVEAVQMATWELDLIAGKATMDARLCELLGRPDLVNKPIPGEAMLEFTAPEDRNVVRGLFTALIKGESEFVRDKHNVMHADGHRVPIFAHVGVAERSIDGRAVRLVGVTQDLSEQKETERVLREAKERAEAASQAKSNFLATMSHEIRTPLNGILGVSQLLNLSNLDERQRKLVETLQSSGRTLSSVIEDILDISRIEAGKLSLVPEPVNVTTWIADTLAPFQALAAQSGLILEHDISVNTEAVHVFDPQRTSQIVTNFVSNAIKFTEKGRVCVRVTLTEQGRLRVDVSDTGPGITTSLCENIFDRFTQGDMSPSRAYGGSGLGLAIAKELADLAGGEIGVQSFIGEGSTFWVEIPAPKAPRAKPLVGGSLTPVTIQGLKALIVEDNAINRETLSEMLAQNAIASEAVSDGEQALKRLRTEVFDLVLLDLHMPGMGGCEVLRTLRTEPGYPNTIPVILVSADATPQARQDAAAFGAQAFLTKPLDMAALIAEIDTLFTGRQAS